MKDSKMKMVSKRQENVCRCFRGCLNTVVIIISELSAGCNKKSQSLHLYMPPITNLEWFFFFWFLFEPTVFSDVIITVVNNVSTTVIITSEKTVGSNKNQKKKNHSKLVIGGMYKCRDCDFLLQPADNSDIIITTETAAETSTDVFLTFGDHLHFCNLSCDKNDNRF